MYLDSSTCGVDFVLGRGHMRGATVDRLRGWLHGLRAPALSVPEQVERFVIEVRFDPIWRHLSPGLGTGEIDPIWSDVGTVWPPR